MKTTDEVWSEYVALRENAPEPRPLVKARKSHFCELCGTTIRPGSLYVRETIFPGDFNDNDVPVLYKAHIECDQLALVFFADICTEHPMDPGTWREILASHDVVPPHPAPTSGPETAVV